VRCLAPIFFDSYFTVKDNFWKIVALPSAYLVSSISLLTGLRYDTRARLAPLPSLPIHIRPPPLVHRVLPTATFFLFTPDHLVFTETKKPSPNTGARANNTLHK